MKDLVSESSVLNKAYWCVNMAEKILLN